MSGQLLVTFATCDEKSCSDQCISRSYYKLLLQSAASTLESSLASSEVIYMRKCATTCQTKFIVQGKSDVQMNSFYVADIEEPPSKCVSQTVTVRVTAQVLFIDFEGRSDGESIRKIVEVRHI